MGDGKANGAVWMSTDRSENAVGVLRLGRLQQEKARRALNLEQRLGFRCRRLVPRIDLAMCFCTLADQSVVL